jgi:hypothetical protein
MSALPTENAVTTPSPETKSDDFVRTACTKNLND